MSSITLSARLSHEKVALGQKHVIHLMAALTGAKTPDQTRKPLAISVAIDCSGSMAGEKIEYAKQSLSKLVDHLAPEDTLSVVAFSSTIWSVFGPEKMSSEAKDRARKEIRNLRPQAMTNISGALYEAYERLAKHDAKKGIVARTFLFTDGLPTDGVTDFEELCAIAGKRPEGSAVTAFGYGRDHDPELLRSMARRGGGNFWFIETPDGCAPIFGRELGGLLSCVAQAVKLTLETKADVRILEVVNDLDVDATDEGTKATVTVDDVYAEETRKVLFKLELPSMDKSGRPFKLGDLKLVYQDLLGKDAASAELAVKIDYVPEEKAQKEPHQDVAEQIAILDAAKAQEEARKLANRGQFAQAQNVIKTAMLACRSVKTDFSDRVANDLQQNVLRRLSDAGSWAQGGAHYLVSNVAGYHRGRSSNVGTASLYGTKAQEHTAASFADNPSPSVQPPASTPNPVSGNPSKRRRNRS